MPPPPIEPTAPQDRVPVTQKVVYGLGALTNNLLSGAFGAMTIILNLGLGMDPAAIGLIQACSRITDAVTDPIMGFISDKTRTRWGRRRPYIVIGAILSGLVFALVWQIPAGHSQRLYIALLLIGINLFYAAYTVYAAPFIALGYEMTVDYYERIRIQGYGNVIGQIPWLALPWFYSLMQNKRLFHDSVQGARMLAIAVGIVVIAMGVLPGIFCREPLYGIARRTPDATAQQRTGWTWHGVWSYVREFFKGFGITLRNRRFLELAAVTFLVFNGFMMISGLGPYVIIFYVFGGDNVAGAQYVGLFGTVLSLCTFVAIILATWLATRIGKKWGFIVSTSLAIAGYVLKWFCYRPGSPNLIFWPAPLIAFGLGGLFTTVSAMIADVCDLDELENGQRREGTFGAIYWFMVKLGTAVALALSGYLLNLTGFLVQHGANQSPHTLLLMRIFEVGVPILAYGLAIVAMLAYDLTPERMREIRALLRKRRAETPA